MMNHMQTWIIIIHLQTIMHAMYIYIGIQLESSGENQQERPSTSSQPVQLLE